MNLCKHKALPEMHGASIAGLPEGAIAFTVLKLNVAGMTLPPRCNLFFRMPLKRLKLTVRYC